ncbi:MAG TPA: DUF1549 domain-containing protein, partial [Burkholderiaceae bacterium]|nr:DUF1549 domain-containing protein [Burkholderiaceae bacterium]
MQDPAPPEIKTPDWARNDLDRFVLARLEQKGLTPSPEADRHTLIRRLTLDLIGLLPTPQEVENFVNDSSPDAYNRLVDRLLASPHYGERWGRHWLDQARYADSNGYTIDSERVMWPYRDWVIRALNEDMPFTQFTIEQLAGDLLPNATKLQQVATAFHRNTMINEEGGTDAEQFRNEAAVDRANTTATVWLGLTLGCAQCHTHKFDPITHREYYELFAFFNQSSDVNNKGETVQVAPNEILSDSPLDEATQERAKIVRQRLTELQKTAAQRQSDWQQQLAKAPPAEPKWEPLAIESYQSVSNRPLRRLDDGSILASRDGAANDTYEITATLPLEKLAALRLTVLPHETLDNGGSGTAGNGNFILSELELEIEGKDVPLPHALADHQKDGYAVISTIDGRKNTGWALEMGKGGKGEHQAWFYLAEPVALQGKKITIRMRHDQNNHYLIGRFALTATDSVPGTHPDKQLWDTATATAVKPADSRSKEDTDLLNRVFADLDRDLAMAQREVQQLGGSEVAVMIMQAAEKPRETFIHLRG